jgi:hypothetical protein
MANNTNKSRKLSPSSRPCDVAYRLKRVNELLNAAQGFLDGIDAKALPGSAILNLDNLLFRTRSTAKGLTKAAPKKKVHKKVTKAKKAAKVKVSEFHGFDVATVMVPESDGPAIAAAE